MRVVIAEDSVLLREGLERLLGENGFEVVGTCGDADDLAAQGAQLRAGRRDRGHPAAADPHRRGHARRDRDQGGSSRRSACSCSPSTSSSAWPEAPVGLRRGRRLPAEGPRQQRGRVRRRGSARRRRRLRARSDHRLDPPREATQRRPARRPDPARARGPRAHGGGPLEPGNRRPRSSSASRAVEKYVSTIFTKLGLPSTGSDSRRVLAVLLVPPLLAQPAPTDTRKPPPESRWPASLRPARGGGSAGRTQTQEEKR